MIEQKKFLDTRTNEIVTQFSLLDIQYMKELTEQEVANYCLKANNERLKRDGWV